MPGKTDTYGGDLAAGLLLLAIGIMVFVGSWSYEFGSLGRMGPGYFPLLLGSVLSLLAVPILLSGLRGYRRAPATQDGKPRKLPGIDLWRPLVLIPVAILLFALLVNSVGLPLAAFFCATLAGLADRSNRMIATTLVAAAAAVVTSFVFVFIFGLPIKLMPF